MENFTPISSLSGGLLIGLAAALLWVANGRIAGISGIVGNLPSASTRDIAWRAAFLAGLIAAPWCYAALAGAPPIRLDATVPVVIAGGLLVGFGTTARRWLHQWSWRLRPCSPLTPFDRRHLLFMAAGFITVFVMRHVVGD